MTAATTEGMLTIGALRKSLHVCVLLELCEQYGWLSFDKKGQLRLPVVRKLFEEVNALYACGDWCKPSTPTRYRIDRLRNSLRFVADMTFNDAYERMFVFVPGSYRVSDGSVVDAFTNVEHKNMLHPSTASVWVCQLITQSDRLPCAANFDADDNVLPLGLYELAYQVIDSAGKPSTKYKGRASYSFRDISFALAFQLDCYSRMLHKKETP